MAKCVSCRIEWRREWLGDFARHIPRIAARLTACGWLGFIGFVVGVVIVGKQQQDAGGSPSDLVTILAVLPLIASAFSLAVRALLIRVEPDLRRRSVAPIPQVVLPREQSGGPSVEPTSGSAYRSATQREPLAPPPLCTRHEALARQNQRSA